MLARLNHGNARTSNPGRAQAQAAMGAAAMAFMLLMAAGAPAVAQTSNEAKFCQHINYGGKCFTIRKGGGSVNLTEKPFPGGGNWNDSISSIRVGANVRVLAWEHTNWTGRCITFSGGNTGSAVNGNYSDLTKQNANLSGRENWNDRITSYSVEGGDRHCP